MKIFVFERVNKVTCRYHEEGGLVVVARDREHVEELIKAEGSIEINKEEWKEVIEYELAKDEEPRVFIFPDAGCC